MFCYRKQNRLEIDLVLEKGTDETQARSAGTLLSWRDLDNRDWLGR